MKITMIDDIRNFLGDIASGTIKNERIALSAEKATEFERKLGLLIQENSDLAAQVSVLQRKNEELQTEVENLLPSGEPTVEEDKILNHLFDCTRGDDTSEIAKAIQIELGMVEYHVQNLVDKKLLSFDGQYSYGFKVFSLSAGGRRLVASRR